jgi:hypothetical protein
MYNTNEFQVICDGKPMLVSKLTEEEAKQELCAAMAWIEVMRDKVIEMQDFVNSWSIGETYGKRV